MKPSKQILSSKLMCLNSIVIRTKKLATAGNNSVILDRDFLIMSGDFFKIYINASYHLVKLVPNLISRNQEDRFLMVLKQSFRRVYIFETL